MDSPCCLTDPSAIVVIDSSVAINITATGFGLDIIKALPNPLHAVDTVCFELDGGRKRGRPHADMFDELVSAGHIKIVQLANDAIECFEDLVIGPATDTLDDGEAATIAYAATVGAIPVLDERKATRICGQRFSEISIGCSTDLFSHPNVEQALGRQNLSNAVFSALKHARMRVLPHYIDWVVELIGKENAATCPSLPRSARNLV